VLLDVNNRRKSGPAYNYGVRKEGSQVERRLNFLLELQLDIRPSRSYLKEPPASKGHFHLRGMKQNDMLNLLQLKSKGDRSGLFEGDTHKRRFGISPKGWDDVGCLGGYSHSKTENSQVNSGCEENSQTHSAEGVILAC